MLVNNAGIAWGAPFDEFPEQGWDKVFAVNVKALFMLTQLCRPLLEAAADEDDPARVINIGSIDGLTVPMFDNFSCGHPARWWAHHHAGRTHMRYRLATPTAPALSAVTAFDAQLRADRRSPPLDGRTPRFAPPQPTKENR